MSAGLSQSLDMGASKNRGGPPKWMVKIMENPIKMDDLGVPPFKETPIFLPELDSWLATLLAMLLVLTLYDETNVRELVSI